MKLKHFRPFVDFFIKFISVLLVLYFLLDSLDLLFLQKMVFSNTLSILKSAGVGVHAEGLNLIFDKFVLYINKDCTAWKSFIIFISLIMASRGFLKEKLTGLVVFIPFIYIINLLRIVIISFIGLINPGMIQIVHNILWQLGMIAVVLGSWLIWLKYKNTITGIIKRGKNGGKKL